MFLRAMSGITTLPYWDFDPLIYEASMVGLGPAGSLACDVLILLGAGLCILATARQPTDGAGKLWIGCAVLVGLGLEPILYHGWLGQWATIQQQRVGASWGSAMIAGLALMRLCRDDRYRAAVFAGVLGFVTVLALKGAHQMLIEHPETVADFKHNSEQIFAAQGWTPESSMAKGYQRRLMQNEATGWFGLSNVFASYGAMGVVGFAGLALCVWREPRAQARDARRAGHPNRGALIAASTGLLASIAAVAMAQSKGGTAVALLGAAFLGLILAIRFGKPRLLASRLATRPALLRPLPIALTLVPLAAVVARGLIGERLGELSLLFRWFYMQGATRIATGYELNGVHVGNWLLGVGPDGFKDAYLVAKNPLNPEEIVSPHSILFDWWADLGVFGLAWGALFFVWLWWIGAAISPSLREGAGERTEITGGASSDCRPFIRLVAAIPV
ncbi:MAG TPA: O-antigen ligase family protein, partial [Thermoanaerobaculia bacterium]|nr:O-antigen ligase family protein [Thermoanaerobaculia bacterium]